MWHRNVGVTVVMLTAALAFPGRYAWAQRLPPPDSSRPPRLTLLPPDSIRRQVRELRLYELLGSLQRGDSAAINAALAGVQWDSVDATDRNRPQCRTVGGAVMALAARRPPGENRLLPIFFSQAPIVDSADMGWATIRVDIRGTSRAGRSATIRLAYRDSEQRWVRARGLWAVICSAATEAEG